MSFSGSNRVIDRLYFGLSFDEDVGSPFSSEPIYIDDLEDLLDEGMDSFNATIDDGSIEEVDFYYRFLSLYVSFHVGL